VTCIELAVLEGVVGGRNGGPNRTFIRTRAGTFQADRSDYGYCLDYVEAKCKKANTSWFWGTDERAAAQCALDRTPRTCPATLSGGPASSSPDTSTPAE
jgi:hypothetical protein